MVYEYFLTLPLEMSEIWNSRFSAAKLFYLLNRYGAIANFFLNCILDSLQTESELVRLFFPLSLCSSLFSFFRREPCSICDVSYWPPYRCTALIYLQNILSELPDIGIIGQLPKDVARYHSLCHRLICTSDLCHLPQQLGYLVYIDHTGYFQSCLGLCEDYNTVPCLPMFLMWLYTVILILQDHLSIRASSIFSIRIV